MGIFIIIVAVAIFLYWSLVPRKPKQPTFDDFITKAERRRGEVSHVWLSSTMETLGKKVYYEAKTPDNPKDKKVFTGTPNECEIYAFEHSDSI